MRYFFIIALAAVLITSGCQEKKPLPIIGNIETTATGDTIYPVIRDFSFINQDSQVVSNKDLLGKVTIADFFFTSCPSICPIVKKQELRLYDRFDNYPDLMLVSFTIDPKRDTPERLHLYAQNLEVDPKRWVFLTGPKDELHAISKDYVSIVLEDPDAPGGFDHSGRLILVDKNAHVRSFCNGTDPKEVDRFMEDVQWLLDNGGE
ncbi:MAG TPA: SCO family protein [Saprospiraceae bacterium]|nr:SCO family protein [Saprospiraceae bacterium]